MPENRSAKGAYTTDVDEGSAGQRVDNFLLRVLKGVPRAHVYQLIRSGQVRINRGRVRASYRLRLGDKVRIPPVRMTASGKGERVDPTSVYWLEERILFEDDRILVLDKPAGMAVHGGSGIALGCIEALRSLRPRAPNIDLVHRLDRGTSGCLIIAKRRSALRTLHALLRDDGIEKRYLALVEGDWSLGSMRIDAPMLRQHRVGSALVKIDPNGKAAISDFQCLESYAGIASLVEVRISTGRTHQIRVHAAHAGHPVAGDSRYGNPRFNEQMADRGLTRMFLHAHAISFTWPQSGVEVAVSAPLPDELRTVLNRLEGPG